LVGSSRIRKGGAEQLAAAERAGGLERGVGAEHEAGQRRAAGILVGLRIAAAEIVADRQRRLEQAHLLVEQGERVRVRALPVQGRSVPAIIARNVVLPEPFGPLTAMRSGPVMANDRPRLQPETAEGRRDARLQGPVGGGKVLGSRLPGFGAGEHGQRLRDAEQVGDRLIPVGLDRLAEHRQPALHRYRPAMQSRRAGDQAQQRGLADAVAADQPGALGSETEIEIGVKRLAVRCEQARFDRTIDAGTNMTPRWQSDLVLRSGSDHTAAKVLFMVSGEDRESGLSHQDGPAYWFAAVRDAC
jgi:hypothetical protein